MRGFKLFFRDAIWQILGVNYREILKKLDFTLLKSDKYSCRGVGSYDNGASVWRWSTEIIEIGNYCSIAHGVNFIVDDGYHTCSEVTSYPFVNNLTSEPELVELRNTMHQQKGISVGHDVWIGMNAVVLPGTRIGNGVTIAAGAVVSGFIPDYAVYGGVPAKLIKMKHSDAVIKQLNSIQWWLWTKEEIATRRRDFYLPIELFIEKYAN